MMDQGLLTQSEEPFQNIVANGNGKNLNTAVADGGNVTADEAFTDDEIRSAINSRSCLADIAEIRDVLQKVQQSFEEFWAAHMDGVHQGTLDLVETDNSILIFADNTGQFWNEEFAHPPLADRNLSEKTPKVIKRLHHTWARRHTNYGWSNNTVGKQQVWNISTVVGSGGTSSVTVFLVGLLSVLLSVSWVSRLSRSSSV